MKPATIALLNLGLCSLVLYAVLLLRFPLLTLYARQRFVLKDFTQSNPTTGALLLLGLIVVFVCYGLGAMVVRRIEQIGRATALTILLIPLACGVAIFLTQSISSTDVYDYLFRGRMIAHYGANTFITAPNAYGNDPLFPYVVWRNAVSAYGPLWEGMSWLSARLAGEFSGGAPQPNDPALFKLLIAYKLIEVVGWVLCGWAIWATLRRTAPKLRWFGLYLWLWNPMVLWETLAAGHNDVWMVLPIVLAVWAFSVGVGGQETRRQGDKETESGRGKEPTTDNRQPTTDNRQPRTDNRQPTTETTMTHYAARNKQSPLVLASLFPVLLLTLALLALTVGGLIKYLALILGPLVLVAGLRLLPSWRARAWLIFGAGALCIGLIVFSYAPFWVGPQTLINFDHRKHLANSSWLAALRPILAERFTLDQAKTIVTSMGTALLLVGVAWATWRSWRAPERLLAHMTWLLLWFLFVCNPWYQPWYAIWPLALVALQPGRGRLVWATLLFCFTGMLGYYATTFVLPQVGLKETDSAWHGLLTLLIYLPPLLAIAFPIVQQLVAPPKAGSRRGSLRLWLYGITMALAAWAFTLRYPLAANVGILTDIGKLSGYGWAEFCGYVLGIGLMFGVFGLAIRESHFVHTRAALTVVFVCGGAMLLACMLMYPVNAIDSFLYAARSRLLSNYGANPNSMPLAAFPHDPWLPFATSYWAERLSPYGPLWNLLSAPITAVAGMNIAVAVLGFKLLAGVATLFGGVVLARLMGNNRATGALLYLWNPLVLWEGAGNGHNDVVLALLLLLALLAWQRRRGWLVIPLLLAAALLKYVTLPLLPIAAVALWRRAGSTPERRRLVWRSGLLSAAVLIVGLFPFYDLGALLASARQQNDLFYTSPTALAVTLFKTRYATDIIASLASKLGLMLLAFAVLWQMAQVWRTPERLGRAWFEVLFLLVLVGVASSRAWYLIWLVALAAPLYPGWPWRRVLAWSVGGLASYAFFIWIEAWLQPGYDRAQIVGTFLMLIPPVLVWCLEITNRVFRSRISLAELPATRRA